MKLTWTKLTLKVKTTIQAAPERERPGPAPSNVRRRLPDDIIIDHLVPELIAARASAQFVRASPAFRQMVLASVSVPLMGALRQVFVPAACGARPGEQVAAGGAAAAEPRRALQAGGTALSTLRRLDHFFALFGHEATAVSEWVRDTPGDVDAALAHVVRAHGRVLDDLLVRPITFEPGLDRAFSVLRAEALAPLDAWERQEKEGLQGRPVYVFRNVVLEASLRRDQEVFLRGGALMHLPPLQIFTPDVRVLDVGGNLFKALPSWFGELKQLTTLQLDASWVADWPKFFTQLGDCQKLTLLRLASNRIRTLPAEVSCVTSLQVLDLSDNDLTDLPEELADLPHLRELCLDGNRLNVKPAVVQRCTSLNTFSWRGNPWAGGLRVYGHVRGSISASNDITIH